MVAGESERTPAGQAELRTVSLGRTGGRRRAATQPPSHTVTQSHSHITASSVSCLQWLSACDQLYQSLV